MGHSSDSSLSGLLPALSPGRQALTFLLLNHPCVGNKKPVPGLNHAPQHSNSAACPQTSKSATIHAGTQWGRKNRRQARSLLNHRRSLTHRHLAVPRRGEERKGEWVGGLAPEV